MPEGASLPAQLTGTGWLNQPLKSAPRERRGATPAGGVASTLIGPVVLVSCEPSSRVIVQLRVAPTTGPSTSMAWAQSDFTGVLMLQRATTKLPCVVPRYPPFVPTIPSIEYAIGKGSAPGSEEHTSELQAP